MTASVGYDPLRVRQLARRTLESIEALSMIRCDDPLADRAVRVASNARRNLEDAWMPLLREIESSRAMLDWTATTGAGIDWPSPAAWVTHLLRRDVDDGDLLAELRRLDEYVPLVDDGTSPAELDRWLRGHADLAAELARRVRADDRFAAELAAAAYGSPLVGMLTGLADFPAGFRADVLTMTLANPWWEAGWERDKYAAAADTLIAGMLDDPERCLAVLGRPGVAEGLAGWPPLDQGVVAQFVAAALLLAPSRDAGLLPVGYVSLRELVRLANTPAFDHRGFQPGMAVGLAHAIGGYVPTLIPGLENEHAPVQVKSHGIDAEFDFELGSREEVADLLGAVVRTPAARDELGAVLTRTIVDALGPRPEVRIGDAAELAELIELAASNEDEELAIAAAARRSSILQVGAVIGIGLAAGAAMLGISNLQQSILSFSTGRLTDRVADTVAADTVGGSRIRSIAYQSIQIEACRRFAADAGLRRSSGAPHVTAGELRSIRRRLAEVEALLDDSDATPGRRQRAILNAVEAVRAAGGGPYLDGILEENSVDDLNEAGQPSD